MIFWVFTLIMILGLFNYIVIELTVEVENIFLGYLMSCILAVIELMFIILLFAFLPFTLPIVIILFILLCCIVFMLFK